ncbi:MAG: hypothetical protein EOO09_08860 [Chitinophagaceae bacterium]|nr:MAG: hypothetical protein EOO09_08860 [Chitinophagaceae bacterium]
MKNVLLIMVLASLSGCSHQKRLASPAATGFPVLPAAITGSFSDDYGSVYTITDTTIVQQPGNTYQLLSCDTASKVIIARNAMSNHSEQGLYTRIDYMFFEGMSPWTWGYCLTIYNAPTDSAALAAPSADRSNPRKGCNGFPFTRMRRPG